MILFLQIAWLYLPGAFANMAPVIFRKCNFLNTPINKKLFGDHKTYRGFFFGIISSIIIVFLQSIMSALTYKIELLNYQNINIIIFGLLMGIGALLGDLLKSYFKRKLKIRPGKSLPPIDQIDWVIGSSIVLYFYINLKPNFIIYSLIILGILHLLTNILSYKLKIRKTPL